MENCDDKLRELAKQGIALTTAFCAARDAVRESDDRKQKWLKYNRLHVEFNAACHAILRLPAAAPPSSLFEESEVVQETPGVSHAVAALLR